MNAAQIERCARLLDQADSLVADVRSTVSLEAQRAGAADPNNPVYQFWCLLRSNRPARACLRRVKPDGGGNA